MARGYGWGYKAVGVVSLGIFWGIPFFLEAYCKGPKEDPLAKCPTKTDLLGRIKIFLKCSQKIVANKGEIF